ncbi:MAG TPA: HAD family hydrolase [Candidatus Acidoferrales bacterium]|nr:HAD family hydrolase [Candidatus Acidoferrales bacterium]
MPLKAVFFDVGDTLVEGWIGRERTNELVREVLRREFGDRDWYDRFLDADLGVHHGDRTDDAALRQETHRWYEEWFRNAQIGIDDIDVDRLRVAATAPLDLVAKPVPGAFTAVRWCKSKGFKVALVTNTLSRGDAEVWEDWRRFGLADAIDAVASSHSVGWQKPHRAIFERALELTGVRAADTVMVGDRTDADILGAKRLGMRAVLRRTTNPGAMDDAGVSPDAIIDDLTALPDVLTAWIGVPDAQRPLPEDRARRT